MMLDKKNPIKQTKNKSKLLIDLVGVNLITTEKEVESARAVKMLYAAQ